MTPVRKLYFESLEHGLRFALVSTLASTVVEQVAACVEAENSATVAAATVRNERMV